MNLHQTFLFAERIQSIWNSNYSLYLEVEVPQGKGTLINKLIAPLDYWEDKYLRFKKYLRGRAVRPFLWRFWTRLPAKGRIHILTDLVSEHDYGISGGTR